uniref:C8orf76 homolog n=1 Tax=Osmerus mordax TaxID=8014 RepID=C1BJ83_OSMMO|nr:C8orf76 homolog [Osmerus mordax]
MDIFGSTFDDSMFEEARDKANVPLSSYKAKFCATEWFCETDATDTDDLLDRQKVFKFRADLEFRKGNYQKALNDYTSCLALVPEGNLTIKRDVLEAMARCLSHIGQMEQALETVEQLSKEAANTCHLTCILLLKVNIYQYCRDLGNKIIALQQLCCLHPYNQWHWTSLADGYISQLESLSSQAPGLSFLPQENTLDMIGQQQVIQLYPTAPEREDRDSLWLKACMCLLRARLLLRILRNQQSSFVLQSSEKALQRTEEALQHLDPTERTLQVVTEVMGEDLVSEKMREENQDGESLDNIILKNFENRWWNRLLQTGLLGPDGGKLTTDKTESVSEP